MRTGKSIKMRKNKFLKSCLTSSKAHCNSLQLFRAAVRNVSSTRGGFPGDNFYKDWGGGWSGADSSTLHLSYTLFLLLLSTLPQTIRHSISEVGNPLLYGIGASSTAEASSVPALTREESWPIWGPQLPEESVSKMMHCFVCCGLNCCHVIFCLFFFDPC